MELPKLENHDFPRNLEIAEGLFGTIQHEKAAPNIIESSHRINWFYSQKGFSYLSRL